MATCRAIFTDIFSWVQEVAGLWHSGNTFYCFLVTNCWCPLLFCSGRARSCQVIKVSQIYSPDLQVILLPPMLREVPYWYCRHYASILSVFKEVLRHPPTHNIFALPSFQRPVFKVNLVHLNPKARH
jgi:hypothetical protein